MSFLSRSWAFSSVSGMTTAFTLVSWGTEGGRSGHARDPQGETPGH